MNAHHIAAIALTPAGHIPSLRDGGQGQTRMSHSTVTRASARRPATRLIAVATALAVAALPLDPAQGQGARSRGLPIIRDAEIEQLLRDYTQPLLKAAGLGKQNIQMVIINDRSFNAFVMDGRRIFINVGALMDAKTPNEVIGVLAHETGHIAGGHLARLREELANAQTAAIISMLLGIGAIAAGARASPQSGIGQAGAAAILGPQEMIRRSVLSYQRAQEESADRAAVRFLAATGQSPKGMADTFRRLSEQILYAAHNADPYSQSHPLPKERVQALDALVKTSPHWNRADPPELQLRHNLMRAKLSGFLDRPDSVLRRYPLSDTSLPARYARAISTFRHANLRDAVTQFESLIAAQPNNPYFHEIKGQALLENGRPAEAIGPLRRATALAPNAALIRIMLAQALIATADARNGDEAVALLRTAMQREPEFPDVYSQLAIAYGRKGDYAQADLASAQAAMARGDIKTARELAARAKTRFPTGSPGWVKSDDIVSFKPPTGTRRN